MNDSRIQSKKLPPKRDFSEWYHELLMTGEIVDNRYPVKGMCVWFPFGFALRKNVYNLIRKLLDVDHHETLFPLMIPEYEFMKEAQHIKGFENEVYWVTNGGSSPLEVKLALRPTSETAIYPMLKLWIRSHADLPMRIYQIVNTFRYETKHTRPLIRLREITSFKEAHTAHATWDEAAQQVDIAIERYSEFYNLLAVPFLVCKRPNWDKFPGADYTKALDVIMPDGKTLQVGTAHHLGFTFSKTYDITYESPSGEQEFVSQTCYGISERCIAALISVHGDDKGLVLPWVAAPTQVIIIPILFGNKEKILDVCRSIQCILQDASIRAQLDTGEERPGAKYYKWEMRGVPIRLEIGPKDIEKNSVTLARRDGAKRIISINNLVESVMSEAEEFQKAIYDKACNFMKNKIKDVANIEEAKEQIKLGVSIVPWCGEEDCGHILEESIEANILGEPQDLHFTDNQCAACRILTKRRAYMARQY